MCGSFRSAGDDTPHRLGAFGYIMPLTRRKRLRLARMTAFAHLRRLARVSFAQRLHVAERLYPSSEVRCNLVHGFEIAVIEPDGVAFCAAIVQPVGIEAELFPHPSFAKATSCSGMPISRQLVVSSMISAGE